MQNQVIVSKSGQTIGVHALAPATTIGRRQGSTIQIEDPGLSRLHAVVQSVGSGWQLVDKNSTNGTFLNGARLAPDAPADLRSGDIAELGDFRFQFQLATSAIPVTAVPASVALDADSEPPPPASPLLAHLLDARSRIPLWSEGTTTCRVADILNETHDTKTFRLVGKTPVLFSFKPGQFVTLRLDIDGKDVKRSYSISSSPSRPHALDLTIKRVPGGLVSNWMCDNVKLGDEIEIRGPAGKFSCFNYPSQKMLFVGAGSGITPVMSMLRWIVDTVADVDVLMLVSARSPQDIIFRRELEWITSRHSGVRVIVTVTGRWTGVEAWTGLTGRCDARMLKLLVPDLNDRHVFMCGPGVFMDAVKEALRQIEYPMAQLHSESFGEARVAKGEEVKPRDVPKHAAPLLRTPDPVATGAQGATSPGAPNVTGAGVATPIAALSVAAPPPSVATAAFQVRFLKAGKLITTGGDSNVLDLAEANGVEIDYACRTGSCGSCKVLCKSGTCELDENELSDADKKKGFIYACVARPTSDVEIEA